MCSFRTSINSLYPLQMFLLTTKLVTHELIVKYVSFYVPLKNSERCLTELVTWPSIKLILFHNYINLKILSTERNKGSLLSIKQWLFLLILINISIYNFLSTLVFYHMLHYRVYILLINSYTRNEHAIHVIPNRCLINFIWWVYHAL